MAITYFKPPKSPNTYVNFILQEENSSVTHTHQPCYSIITYGKLDPKVQSIILYQPFNQVSYDKESVKRWLADINEVGFPCYLEAMSEKDGIKIRLNLTEFISKPHLISTLMLARALWENRINEIPERYFQAMDENPEADKLLEIQKAHKFKIEPYGYNSFNINHTVTNHSNRDVDSKLLFKRFREGRGVYESGLGGVSRLWDGKVMQEET